MTSTRTLVAAAVLLAALLGAVGTALAVSPDTAGTPVNRSLSVAGSGTVEVAPDAAVVRLSVTARGPDAANATRTVARDADRLRQTLEELGISGHDLRTVGYDVHGERDSREPGAAHRYVARQRFAVTIDDVDRAGTVIDAAVAGGADDVHGVRYTLSDSAREAARDRALRNAVEDARGEATVLADATGLAVTGVGTVSTTGADVHPVRADVAMATADGGASTRIDARDVTVTATVQVRFIATAA